MLQQLDLSWLGLAPSVDAWDQGEVDTLIMEVLNLRFAWPARHLDARFSLLVEAEAQIDAAFLAQDMPALRKAIASWKSIMTEEGTTPSHNEERLVA